MTIRRKMLALATLCLGLVVAPPIPAVAVEMCDDIDWDQNFETRYAYAESDQCPSQEIGECTSGEFIEVTTYACEAWCAVNWSVGIREDNFSTIGSPCWYECQCEGVPPVI